MIDIDEFIGQRKEEYRKLVDAEMTVCVRFFTFSSFVLEYLQIKFLHLYKSYNDMAILVN